MSAASTEIVSATPSDTESLARVRSFIESHDTPPSRFYLSGADEHDRIALTEELHDVLKQVVQALSRGQSISVLTRDQEISTQQAAEILGISRPTVVRLIDDGALPAHVPGSVRRRLRLADVLAYREELRERRNHFITDSSAAYADADDGDVDDILADVRRRG